MSIQVSSLDDIGELLQVLQDKQRCCAVFGGIRDPQRVSRVRRLSKPDGDYMPTIKAVAHRWCSLDIDKGPMPVGGDMKDLAACSAATIAKLPPEFHGVRHVVQATAGHARKLGGTRLRIWFWMSRWVTGDELGIWLKKYVSDHGTFRPSQPIYTAAPKFLDCHDLLPYRIKGVDGKPEVQVPDPPTSSLNRAGSRHRTCPAGRWLRRTTRRS